MNGRSFSEGAALGAAFMFLFDPDRGRARRSRARARARRWLRRAERLVEAGAQDLGHRARGAVTELASPLHAYDASDDVVAERVRAALGRVCSHPHAIEVAAHDGVVTLKGPVLRTDAGRLVTTIARVRGVDAVHSQLEVHEQADVSVLQGGRRRVRPGAPTWRRAGSPGWRLLKRVAAGLAVASFVERRSG
jgi:hypothetical protein